MSQRLNKYLATNFGVSRREADDLIAEKKVTIDDKIATIGDKVEDGQKISVNGNSVEVTDNIYIMLNKPAGYVSSRKRQGETPTLYELLPEELQNLKNVGRLDKESSGLILLTNDGDFAFSMTHPKFYKVKTYTVVLDQKLEPLHQQMIADFGVNLTDGASKLALTPLDDSRKKWQVEMNEGRNRQIRRTFGSLGYTVVNLHRLGFGKYNLGNLASGEWQKVDKL